MPDNEPSIQTQLAIQRIEHDIAQWKDGIGKMSESLEQLVAMQKDHEVFHAKVTGKLDSYKERINKMETNQTWVVRLVVAAVVVKVISLLWNLG